MDVETGGAPGGGNGGDDDVPSPLADVDHALELHGAAYARTVEVGLALPQFDYSAPGESPLRWETVVAWATRAEELGLDHVWLADHLFIEVEKHGGPAGRFDGFDPLVALAALARATSRVRLGTLVICSQLRPPAVLAKGLATLDRLAGGRLIVGVGAGWYEPEYVAAGIAFGSPGQRVTQLATTIATLKDMWSGAPDAPSCRPGPMTPEGPPVWIGGRGERVMELAARRAEGFNYGGWKAETRRPLDEFLRACERVGRDPATVVRSVNHAVGDPDALPDELRAFDEQGVAAVVVGLGQVPFSVTTFGALERVASALP